MVRFSSGFGHILNIYIYSNKWEFGATVDFFCCCFYFTFSTQNILKKAEENSEREANAIKAHQQLEQVSINIR